MSYKKTLNVPIGIVLILFPLSQIFRIMHWPLGSAFELIMFLAIAILYGIRYGLNPTFVFKDTIKIVMATSWVLVNVFSRLDFLGFEWLFILLIISGVIFLGWELLDVILEKSKENRLNIWQWIGVILISIKILFKVMYWPGVGPVLLISLIGFISLGIGFFVKEKKYTVHLK